MHRKHTTMSEYIVRSEWQKSSGASSNCVWSRQRGARWRSQYHSRDSGPPWWKPPETTCLASLTLQEKNQNTEVTWTTRMQTKHKLDLDVCVPHRGQVTVRNRTSDSFLSGSWANSTWASWQRRPVSEQWRPAWSQWRRALVFDQTCKNVEKNIL